MRQQRRGLRITVHLQEKTMPSVPRISVEITYRDDKVTCYDCNDYPSINDTWVTLFMNTNDVRRICVPVEGIKHIEYYYA